MSELSAIAVPPNEGRVLRAFGEAVTVYLGGAETRGRYTSFVEETPPGGGPPPHYHDREDEWFFVLEGRAAFLLEDAWEEMPVGTVVFVPRRTVHTFTNPGELPLRLLVHTAPSGFEIFFERCAEEFARHDPPDMDRIFEISAEHGIHFVTQ